MTLFDEELDDILEYGPEARTADGNVQCRHVVWLRVTCLRQKMRECTAVSMDLDVGAGAVVRSSHIVEAQHRRAVDGCLEDIPGRFNGQPCAPGVELASKMDVERSKMFSVNEEMHVGFRVHNNPVAQKFGYCGWCLWERLLEERGEFDCEVPGLLNQCFFRHHRGGSRCRKALPRRPTLRRRGLTLQAVLEVRRK